MRKLSSIVALSAIAKTYADDPQTIAQRVELDLSNNPQRRSAEYDGEYDIFGRKLLGSDSVMMFHARNSDGNEQATGRAPRRPPRDRSRPTYEGLPTITTGIVSTDTNAHLLASHGFQSPYYPNTSTHTCVNDHMYPVSYLYNVGYYFSHSAVECCQSHFSQSIDHCTKAIRYENQGSEQSSSLQLMTSPVSGAIPIGKKKPIINHYTELKTQPHRVSSSWWQGWQSSKSAKITSSTSWEVTSSWLQGSWETAWWHGAKSSKKSKHCKSAANGWWSNGWDTKSAKSKGCDHHLPMLWPAWPGHPPAWSGHPPKMLWPTYSPTSINYPTQPSPPPKMPTMQPRPPSPITFPTYSPTKGDLPILPTMMPRPPTPKQRPTQLPTKGSFPTTLPPLSPPPSPLTPIVPTSPKPNPTVPTYAPTEAWPTWAPTSGSNDNTRRPTFAPTPAGSAGPTVPPLDLLVWGSPRSTSQTISGNILTPLDTGIQVIDASAGTRYSIYISPDGTAYSAGVIVSARNTDGRLGIRPQDLVDGQNLFQPITLVFDKEQNGVTSPPRFAKAYAGVEMEAGNTHTMLIDNMGRVWATGSNTNGQLCLGDEIDRLIPEKIPFPTKIVDIAVGGEFTLLLAEDGMVYGCGSNPMGQLGLGPELQAVNQPTNLGIGSPAISVSAGKDHSLIMADDGIYVMGSNEFGQLCTNTNGEPLLIPRALAIDEEVVSEFQAIQSSSFLLYNDGSVNGCGKNNYGQLGNGSNENTPNAVVETRGIVTLLGAGPSAESVFFAHLDGSVWGTGLNSNGQLGIGDTNNKNVPTLVETENNIRTMLLSAGGDHTLALKTGETSPTSPPKPKPPSPTPPPVMISPSPTIAMQDGASFWFWGEPKSIGEDAGGITVEEPIKLGEGVIDAGSGSHYSMLILNDGSVVSGGFIRSLQDYSGHLGRDPSVVVRGLNALTPVDKVYDAGELISAPSFHKVFAGVENRTNTGIIHSILLDRMGRVYATGSNNAGQLCLGNRVDQMIPVRIPIESRIVDVAIGGEHTLLLDEFGSVYGCGSNVLGQLGLGVTIDSTSSPMKVPGVADITNISAGKDHSILKGVDEIYVTGSNRYGQLCTKTGTTELFIPTKMDLDDGVAQNIVQFDAIATSTFVLYADGSVNSCGRNNWGQLGNGSNENVHVTTVMLDRVVRIVGVGPSAESAFFVTNNQEMFGTGLNDKGQLGVGDAQDRNIPTKLPFEEEAVFTVLSAARDHTIALARSGSSVVSPTKAPVPMEPVPQSAPTVSPTKATGTLPTAQQPLPTYSPTSAEPEQPTLATLKYYWGSLESLGDTGESATPEGRGTIAVDVSAGSKHSIIVLPDGSAQSAGYIDSLNDYNGHLGRGNDVTQGLNGFATITNVLGEGNDSIIAPFFVKAYAGAEQFSSPGSMHSVLLDNEGRVYAAGSNSKGQLCLGDFADRYIPQQISSDKQVVAVALGNEHTLLLYKDGSVYGCGSNEFGQLGLGGDVKVQNSPTEIEVDGNVDGISAGLAFSLFKSSKGLFVTGNNSYQQLCFDTNGADVLSPRPLSLGSAITVDLLTSFEAIQSSAFILFKDGGVAACGRNNFGQLGNGSNDDVMRTLVPIPGNTPIRKLGVGPSALSAFFINTDGEVYATGLNDRGQLGTGDTDNRNSLTKIEFPGVDMIRAEQVSASNDHTLSRILVQT